MLHTGLTGSTDAAYTTEASTEAGVTEATDAATEAATVEAAEAGEVVAVRGRGEVRGHLGETAVTDSDCIHAVSHLVGPPGLLADNLSDEFRLARSGEVQRKDTPIL